MSGSGHGGGVDRAARELGVDRQQLLDFSASINPLGLPDSVRRVLIDSLERLTDYPEVAAESFRDALSRFHNLPEVNLLPGSGSTELIYLLPEVLRPKRALIVEPAFSEYAPALERTGCQVDRLALSPEDDFRFAPQRLLEALRPDTELVWLANPGNPSGVTIAPAELSELAGAIGSCRLVIDEAFIDFCPEHSLIDAVTGCDNLFVLRSLTKFYAIPGLRAGYLAGPAAEVARLAAEKPPWSLSSMAIAAARACLEDGAYRRRTLEEIPRLRQVLREGLEQLGIHVYPSRANYLLLRIPDRWSSAEVICQRAMERGVLLRNCANFVSLDNRHLRIAVRDEEQNRALLKLLRDVAES